MTDAERQQAFYQAVRAAELAYGLTIQAEVKVEQLGEAVLMRPGLTIVPLAGWQPPEQTSTPTHQHGTQNKNDDSNDGGLNISEEGLELIKKWIAEANSNTNGTIDNPLPTPPFEPPKVMNMGTNGTPMPAGVNLAHQPNETGNDNHDQSE
jgi:hypothetical protein